MPEPDTLPDPFRGGWGRFLRDACRLSLPFFNSEEKWPARLMLALILALNLDRIGKNSGDGQVMIDATHLKAHRTAASLPKKGLFPAASDAQRAG